jgi:hypothetical protein
MRRRGTGIAMANDLVSVSGILDATASRRGARGDDHDVPFPATSSR